MARDDTVKTAPGFWMNETSGALQPAVIAYLKGDWLSQPQVVAIRAYLRQWMAADWKGELVAELRADIDEIHTKSDIDDWVEKAMEIAIDPF